MAKKYQIFISSTFRDLSEQRAAVSKIILDLDHIPAGMEMFSATDMDQMTYIKQIIDQCDYYVLIVAGKYGSLSPNGISYTELEYDYAVESGRIVLGFIFEDASKLLASEVESDPEIAKKLSAFVEKIKTGRIVQFWKTQDELSGKVALSLTKAFARFPQIGWVRGDILADETAVRKLNEKNEEIDRLRSVIEELNKDKPAHVVVDLADLDDHYEYIISHDTISSINYISAVINTTWRKIVVSFNMSFVLGYDLNALVQTALTSIARGEIPRVDHVRIEQTVISQVGVQLELLGIIARTNRGLPYITDLGKNIYMTALAVPKRQ